MNWNIHPPSKFQPRNVATTTLLAAVIGLSGCTSNFAIRRVAPAPAKPTSIAQAGTADRGLARAAAADVEALRVLDTTCADANRPATWPMRREAAEELIDAHGATLLAAPQHTLPLLLPDGRILRLRLQRGSGENGTDPRQFVSLEPTDHFVVETTAPIVRTPGIGVPLAATLRPTPPISVPGPVPVHAVSGFTWPVTAVPVWRAAAGGDGGRTLDFDLYDPHPAPHAVLSDKSSPPLAADYTTPAAVTLAHFRPQDRGIRDFLGGGKDFASAGIYAYQPLHPDKIPVVLVHGLISDPTTFHYLLNALENDQVIRRRFQLLFFYYPSSLPVTYSAMLLREDLEKLVRQLDPQRTHPLMHQIALVGHSMGGLLCQLAISDGGNVYYRHFFRKPLDQLSLTTAQRALLRRAFYYRADPDVSQVIFIATPHRGSQLAAGGITGWLGRLLVHLPTAVSARVGLILLHNRAALMSGLGPKLANSINSLTPDDPLITAVNDMTMRPGLGIHSIIGNRGLPGPLALSSDGVVPYTSSHLAQAQSETIVPADHSGTLLCPQTAAEVIKVLHAMVPER